MNPSASLTAAQAIKRECRWCSGVTPEKCWTTVCKLSPNVYKCRSSVKRIKAHCQDCGARDIGETPYKAVATCNGHLLRENGNTVRWTDSDGKERGVCFLHPYRFGKNPGRTKYPSPPRRKQAATPARGPKSAPESTIASGSAPEGVR